MSFKSVHSLVHDWELQEQKMEAYEKHKKKRARMVELLEELFHYFEDDSDLPKHDYFLEKIINTLEEC
ncbi:MAG: hypothetical protein HZR80_20975 [Candidatus Heimdallarchaeota archaeon]